MNLTPHIKLLTLLALLVNAAAMLSPILIPGDSIVYASLSQRIAESNDWWDLVLDGQDWLDKPHMPFWITAAFFKLGGVSAFTYILPGFLFHLIGAYFTYRIARLFYGREVAWLSVLVYMSTYHLMDSAIEVKAEAYLTGFIMGAAYYLLRFDARAKLKYLLLGALLSACAVMTKGVFTLITITSGLVCMWLYQRQWQKLLLPKWWFALGLTLLFTAPEVWALYLQFDSHPEKLVFGQTHVSGIRFFLWDSQFGRFFNTGPIRSTSGHPLYFVLVFLWAFLPWVPVFIAAMVAGVRRFSAQTADQRAHFVFLCGAFFITFLLFSATSFQLDHYTVILFPFAAILSGKYLQGWIEESIKGKGWLISQLGVAVFLVVLAMGLSIYIASSHPQVLMMELALAGLLTVMYFTLRKRQPSVGVLDLSVFSILMVFAFLSLTSALTFRTIGTAYRVSEYLTGKPQATIYVYKADVVARELALYQGNPCLIFDSSSQLPKSGGYYVLLEAADMDALNMRAEQFEIVETGNWTMAKTGIFPRFMRFAKGTEPLQEIRLLWIKPS